MFSAGAGVFFPEPEFFLPEPEPEPEVKNPEFAQHYLDSHGNVPLIPLGGLCLLHSIFASPPNIHLWLCQCCR